MSGLLVAGVLGLALLDMLSPALVGVVIYVLLRRPERVGVLLFFYLGTVAVSYFALGVLLLLGLDAVLPAIDPNAWRRVQGGLGAALFALSWFIPDKGNATTRRAEGALTPASMVMLGLGTWLFEFYTAVPFFAATGLILSAGLQPAQWLPLLGAYVGLMVLPGLALYLAWLLVRDRLEARLQRWHDKLGANSRATVGWMLGIVGVLLVLNAIGDVTIAVGG